MKIFLRITFIVCSIFYSYSLLSQTWQQKSFDNDYSFLNISKLSNSEAIAFGFNSNSLRTTDSGLSWEKYDIDHEAITGYEIISTSLFLDSTTGFVVAVDVPSRMGYLIKTTDGGESWSTLFSGFNQIITSIEYLSKEILILFGSNGMGQSTCHVSYDGGASWTVVDLNSVSTIRTSYLTPDGNLFFGDKNGKVLCFSDTLQTLKVATNLNKDIMQIKFFDNNIGFICGKRRLLYKTIDGGITWNDISEDIPEDNNGQITITDIIPLNSKTYIILSKRQSTLDTEIFLTQDGGLSWQLDSQIEDDEKDLRSICKINDTIVCAVGTGLITRKNISNLVSVKEINKTSNSNNELIAYRYKNTVTIFNFGKLDIIQPENIQLYNYLGEKIQVKKLLYFNDDLKIFIDSKADYIYGNIFCNNKLYYFKTF